MSHRSARGDGGPTLVLGFDALDFRYLDAFADSLPNFSALRDRGVEAPLRSTYPPWTPSAWPSMYTGVDPSHHGVYGFFAPDDEGGTDRLVDRDDVRAPALWNYLTDAGDGAVVLNVPVTHPAEPIEGALVPGYLAPEDAGGYPEGVRDDLDDALGEPYTVYAPDETNDDADARLDGYVEVVERRAAAAVHLLEECDWRLAFLQVQKTDGVFHSHGDRAAHERVYRAADRFLGTVLDAVGDVNVVVCSDHGMGPVRGYRVYLNQVLADHGYVEATRDAEARRFDDEKAALAGQSDGESGESPPRAAARSVAGALRRVGVTPGRVYGAADRLGVAGALRRVVPDDLVAATTGRVDRERSAAYCAGGSRLGVRVNLAGRDPGGVVPPDEYEAVRDDLVAVLSDLRTPDGEPVFDLVARREEVYDGPRVDGAPDVLCRPTDMDHLIYESLVGRQFLPLDLHGHKFDGVFLAAGPAVADGATPSSLSLTDVAPVVMAMLEYAVPARMTGSVPEGLLDVPVATADYGDVPYGTDESREERDGRVEERLRDLGYL